MSKQDPTRLAPLKIIVTPAPSGASRYVARLDSDDRVLCVSRTRFFDAARELVANGYDPSVTLIMCHAGSDTACLIAALCVQAIWMASAPSTSSFGAAASIIASAAFIESSEMPPQGERDADCIWNKETFTKSLDIVPRASFSRFHQFALSPSGGCTCATLPSDRNI